MFTRVNKAMSRRHRSRDVVCRRQCIVLFVGCVPFQFNKNPFAIYVTALASVQECNTIALAKFQRIFNGKKKKKLIHYFRFIFYEFAN